MVSTGPVEAPPQARSARVRVLLRPSDGAGAVLATVIARRGSTPATPGQKLLLLDDRSAVGTIGGGALERRVLAAMTDRLRELVDPLCAELGLSIYDLDMNGGVFRVAVDKDGGVGLTDIAELTRRISRALDEHDPIAGQFTLEVSSPGLERALRTPSHWQWAIGRQVSIKTIPDHRLGREQLRLEVDRSNDVLDRLFGSDRQLHLARSLLL